jgi:16S rRNA (guanine527-N7)-methyltransferase
VSDVRAELFGANVDLAERYAAALATDGVVRGLIGPREADRVWDRHLFNCAAMAPLLPPSAYVIDVGSGAGLPGVVLAIARPDIEVALVEPLARRTAFLDEVVAALGLAGRVLVVRARAEDVARNLAMFHVKPADVVTARAVAPLDRLAGWCLPLAATGGHLLALKGASAADEVDEHRAAITRLGGGTPTIRLCGEGIIDPPATIVEIVKEGDAKGVHNRESGRAKAGRRAQN